MSILGGQEKLDLPKPEAIAAALLVGESRASLALQGGRPHAEVAANARAKLADRLG